jgi:hypothetical protein
MTPTYTQALVYKDGTTTRIYPLSKKLPESYWRLKSKSGWRRLGRKVKDNEKPKALKTIGGFPRFKVYSKGQTRPTRARPTKEAKPVAPQSFWRELADIE